jgi:hypothetical protein
MGKYKEEALRIIILSFYFIVVILRERRDRLFQPFITGTVNVNFVPTPF